MAQAESSLKQSSQQRDIGTWLDELFAALHGVDGLVIGTRERLDAIAVATAYRASASAVLEPADYDRLGRILAAVLAKSEHQRKVIRDHCQSVFNRRIDGGGVEVQYDADAPLPRTPLVATRPKRSNRNWWSIALALLFLSMLAASIVLWSRTAPPPTSLPEREPSPAQGTAPPPSQTATTAAPAKTDEPLTETEIAAAERTVISAALGARYVTLWELSRGLARPGDVGRNQIATFKLLQLHSGLTSTGPIDLQDAAVREYLLWAWLYIDKPSRRAEAQIVKRVAAASPERPVPEVGSRITAMPTASGAYLAPWWLFALMVSIPLVALISWILKFGDRKRQYLENVLARGTGRSDVRVLKETFDTESLVQQQQALRSAARHLASPTDSPTRNLNVEATIDASLARGGIFTPRYALRRTSPEYLALVMSHGPDDQEADRLSYVVERLSPSSERDADSASRPMVSLQDVLFRQDTLIRRVYMEHDTDRVFVGHTEARVRLAELNAKTNGHRLIVLGSGEGLLDPVTLMPQPWAVNLKRWDVRALATPVPESEWGVHEARLSGLMDGPLFRTTARGLEQLAIYLRERDGHVSTPSDYVATAKRPWRFDSQRFMIELPYDEPQEWQQLSRELDDYLGSGSDGKIDTRGREWLRALAVYPALRWDLTSYLGLRLSTQFKDGTRRALYDDEIATRLSVLPWFQEGRMPRWVRQRLISELSPKRRREVIRAIGQLLVAPAKAGDTRASVRLPISAHGSAVGVLGGEGAIDGSTRTPRDDLAANDRELLELLDKEPISLLEGRARTWRRWLASLGGRFAMGERLTGAVLCTYLTAALWLVPKPWGGAAATGGWWGIALLSLGLVTVPFAAWLARSAAVTVESVDGEVN